MNSTAIRSSVIKFNAVILSGIILLSIVSLPAQSQDFRATSEAIQKKFDALLQKGDVKGLAMLYTEDAQLFYPEGDILQGRKAVEEANREYAKEISSGKLKVEVNDIEMEQHGDTAYRIGRFKEIESGGKVRDEGIFWWILKRVNGEWKIHRDIYNSTLKKEQSQKETQPGSEHKFLEKFVGEWVYHGTQTDSGTVESPFGQAGDFSGKFESCLIQNGFFLQTKTSERNPGGYLVTYDVEGYDPQAKKYVSTSFNSDGSTSVSTATWDGDIRTVQMTVKNRKGEELLVKEVREFSQNFTSFVSVWELSVDGGKTWRHWAKYSGVKVVK